MKRFRFTLQALWTLRQRQENEALEAHGRALQKRQAAQHAVEQADRDLVQASDELRRRLETGCEAAAALQFRGLCTAIQERRSRCREGLTRAEAEVQRTFTAMLEARRQREVVDKLHEHQQAQYAREVAVAETKLLDEMALRRTSAALGPLSSN